MDWNDSYCVAQLVAFSREPVSLPNVHKDSDSALCYARLDYWRYWRLAGASRTGRTQLPAGELQLLYVASQDKSDQSVLEATD